MLFAIGRCVVGTAALAALAGCAAGPDPEALDARVAALEHKVEARAREAAGLDEEVAESRRREEELAIRLAAARARLEEVQEGQSQHEVALADLRRALLEGEGERPEGEAPPNRPDLDERLSDLEHRVAALEEERKALSELLEELVAGLSHGEGR
ncbi:MAG: hypothetical protein HY720_15970 [Planctomycetes bacterium]|nr:hypothetical protein [Planctomycetota bacterium]